MPLTAPPERPTLLLIHGFPHDHTLWTAQVSALQDVADVIAPDLRGFGPATVVPDTLTMELFADDLRKLLDARRVKRVVLCGLSMGGYVALAFAAQFPDRVQALVLCNTRAGADTDEGRAGRMATARKAIEEGVPAIAKGSLPKMLSQAMRTAKPELAASVEAMMARQPAAAVAAASRGMAERPDRTPMLASITAPVLIITSNMDELIPMSESARMHAAIAHSELVVVQGAAHLSNVEQPTAFNDAMRHFLRKLR